MIYIAHRGNLNGPNSDKENDPDYVMAAVKAGFHVEVDVWYEQGNFYLGHDRPMYSVTRNFLGNNKFWCHAKNIEALSAFREKSNLIHCFFHNTDDCTLTSQGWIWTYPGKTIVGSKAIAVMPEKQPGWDWKRAGGVCSDFVSKLKAS